MVLFLNNSSFVKFAMSRRGTQQVMKIGSNTDKVGMSAAE
jgi:hypothetical protein